MMGSLPPLHHQLLGPTLPVPATSAPEPKLSSTSWVQTIANVSLGTFSLWVSAINMLERKENEAYKNVKGDKEES